MTLEDWFIVLVLVLSVLGGLSQGFFRSVFSLGGLVVGLALAAWNYRVAAALLIPLVQNQTLSEALGFIFIALLVMVLFGIIGNLLHKAFLNLGLGCLDRLAGGIFGLLQGALLVTLCILAAVTFFPQAHWLVEARLPRLFFGACHLTTRMSPAELAARTRSGLLLLEQQSPQWMHPNSGSKP